MVGGDTVDRGAFWEICEAHAKLDTERTVFYDTSDGFIVDVLGRFLLQVTGHRSQVIVLPIQKVSQTLVKANLRPN